MATKQTAKDKDKGKGILTYRTYNFIDKDPMIDQLRSACQDFFPSPQKGMTISYSNVAAESGVSDTCIRGWFEGETRRPQFANHVRGGASLRLRSGFSSREGDKEKWKIT